MTDDQIERVALAIAESMTKRKLTVEELPNTWPHYVEAARAAIAAALDNRRKLG